MEDQRAKFEAWAAANGFDTSATFNATQVNQFLATQHAWQGWQASAAESAKEIERLREALNEIVDIEDREWKPMRVFRSDEQVARDEARHELAQEIAAIARAALSPASPEPLREAE